MAEFIFTFFGYMIFFYSLGLVISYSLLMWLAYRGLFQQSDVMIDQYGQQIVEVSPYTPGVSIIAPAYNEEKTVVECVLSLLRQKYPKFEVVIVNDGSKDSTLQKMIDYFDLVEVPYAYVEYLHTKKVRAYYRSTNPQFEQLKVVDKENGGTKADPINTGLNVASYDYFINTDVDCILTDDAIFQCMLPVMRYNDVIAVSGMMTMSNGCEVERGVLKKIDPPKSPIPLFQEVEYLRSFFVGKMGWSAINAMSNVSGGYGLFNRRIVLKSGGYSADSFAEDMDVLTRMVGYCCENNLPYRVVQIPKICARTEGPGNIVLLSRQRIRWGRGLVQTFHRHYKKVFNPSYRRLGLVTLPFVFIFEFLAPIIEGTGFFVFLYLAFTGSINWASAVVIFLAIFSFGFMLSVVVLFYTYKSKATYTNIRAFIRLSIAAFLEPVFYHPMLTFFSLWGYLDYIRGAKVVWGTMTRTGFRSQEMDKTSGVDSGHDEYPETTTLLSPKK